MNSDPVLGHDVLQVHGPSNFRSVGCTISFGILDVTIVRYPKVTVDDVEERILEEKQSDKSLVNKIIRSEQWWRTHGSLKIRKATIKQYGSNR